MIEALHSKSRRRREWASDKILSSTMAYGHAFASAQRAPPPRRQLGIYTGQARAEQEAAAELARERAAEMEGDRQRERAREAEVEASRRRVLKPIPAGRSSAPPVQAGSLWPAGIRRPSRGGWR